MPMDYVVGKDPSGYTVVKLSDFPEDRRKSIEADIKSGTNPRLFVPKAREVPKKSTNYVLPDGELRVAPMEPEKSTKTEYLTDPKTGEPIAIISTTLEREVYIVDPHRNVWVILFILFIIFVLIMVYRMQTEKKVEPEKAI